MCVSVSFGMTVGVYMQLPCMCTSMCVNLGVYSQCFCKLVCDGLQGGFYCFGN